MMNGIENYNDFELICRELETIAKLMIISDGNSNIAGSYLSELGGIFNMYLKQINSYVENISKI